MRRNSVENHSVEVHRNRDVMSKESPRLSLGKEKWNAQ